MVTYAIEMHVDGIAIVGDAQVVPTIGWSINSRANGLGANWVPEVQAGAALIARFSGHDNGVVGQHVILVVGENTTSFSARSSTALLATEESTPRSRVTHIVGLETGNFQATIIHGIERATTLGLNRVADGTVVVVEGFKVHDGVILPILVERQPENGTTETNLIRRSDTTFNIATAGHQIEQNVGWAVEFFRSMTFFIDKVVGIWFTTDDGNVNTERVKTDSLVVLTGWVDSGLNGRTLLFALIGTGDVFITRASGWVENTSDWAAHSVAGSIGTDEELTATDTSIATASAGVIITAWVSARNFTFRHTLKNFIVPESTFSALATDSDSVGFVEIEALVVVVTIGLIKVQVLVVATFQTFKAILRWRNSWLGKCGCWRSCFRWLCGLCWFRSWIRFSSCGFCCGRSGWLWQCSGCRSLGSRGSWQGFSSCGLSGGGGRLWQCRSRGSLGSGCCSRWLSSRGGCRCWSSGSSS